MTDNNKSDFAKKTKQLNELATPMEKWDPFINWRNVDMKEVVLKLQKEEANKKKSQRKGLK